MPILQPFAPLATLTTNLPPDRSIRPPIHVDRSAGDLSPTPHHQAGAVSGPEPWWERLLNAVAPSLAAVGFAFGAPVHPRSLRRRRDMREGS